MVAAQGPKILLKSVTFHRKKSKLNRGCPLYNKEKRIIINYSSKRKDGKNHSLANSLTLH